MSPVEWRTEAGAFVFVEDDERLWVYDGQRNLLLFAYTGETFSTYGPQRFPCTVPKEVTERIESNKKAQPSNAPTTATQPNPCESHSRGIDDLDCSERRCSSDDTSHHC
ncbi:MAG: hypothetical protein AB9869_24490 [Verrucomicrobiia bacterium]